MLTFYCPSCWTTLHEEEAVCPKCGYPLENFFNLDYERKLLLGLHHPILERRMMNIQILGNLHSQRALDEFEMMLSNPDSDYFLLREVLIALSKISGQRSSDLLRMGREHDSRLVRELAEELTEERWENENT